MTAKETFQSLRSHILSLEEELTKCRIVAVAIANENNCFALRRVVLDKHGTIWLVGSPTSSSHTISAAWSHTTYQFCVQPSTDEVQKVQFLDQSGAPKSIL